LNVEEKKFISILQGNTLSGIAANESQTNRPAVPSAKRGEPLSSKEAVESWLKPYSIGEKLKTLRLRKKLGLVELGRHTGLSAALLSKLERSKLYPTLPTLARIATVFDVGLDHFFTDERKRHAVALAKKRDRQRFPERPGTSEVAYFFETLDYGAAPRKLNAYYADFQNIAKEKLRPHTHAGAEHLYLLFGTLVIAIGGHGYELEAGDAIYFDSSVPHTYCKSGDSPCAALIVTVP
jgi:transcriptional regulator with XRE-family HTH domain